MSRSVKPIRALARGLDIIWVLNERHSTPARLLGERTGLPIATLKRMLKTLEAVGWVYHNRCFNTFRLTSAVCQLGQHLLTVDCMVEIASPVMNRLSDELGWPSDLAVHTNHGMRVLESTRCLHPEIRNHSATNVPIPLLQSALGRAYLAFCTATEREAILDSLRHSRAELDQAVHNPRRVEDLLENTRGQGYGVAEPGYCEGHSGCKDSLAAIAVPVKTNGNIRACLSLIWLEHEGSLCRIAGERLPALRAAAQEIADRLRRLEAGDEE